MSPDRPLRWLIVEDALRDRQGHWFEYISTFAHDLQGLGDSVTVLADRKAEPFIRNGLDVQAVLPPSIWHRMNKGGSLVRYSRVPIHAWQTVRAVKKHLAKSGGYDIVFVPTVLVHHLLAWTWLIQRGAVGGNARIVLFFPNVPIQCDPAGGVSWVKAPTTRLMRYLFRRLAKEVGSGRVVLGAETRPMQEALTRLSGIPFTYLPHPVSGLELAEINENRHREDSAGGLLLGSYGLARHEKGSDTLFRAVDRVCRRGGAARCRFVVQCPEGFEAERRTLAGYDEVECLTRYFADGEYARQLAKTDIMLLPYRLSSYQLRVSRVAIEAMVNGIPMVVTRGSTLASQAEEFGAATTCGEDDPASLADAIQQAIDGYPPLAERARAAIPKAREHFSVRWFKETVLAGKVESMVLAANRLT
jgi:glycosyltransferase involved in cell wall biosynthesis